MAFPGGILGALQTPFNPSGGIDFNGVENLIDDAIAGGVDGLITPVVASEVEYLSVVERRDLLGCVAQRVAGRVPWIVGASSDEIVQCRVFAELADEHEAAGYLVAVPDALYECPHAIVEFFRAVSAASDRPLLVQDLQWNGPGMDMATIRELAESIPSLGGLKIETIPAGPKYTQVRQALGPDFFISGGWAITQMIEALDRGVDAMIPECSMIKVYKAIDHAYRTGDRSRAVEIHHQLLPILAFTNQEIQQSIAFFKRLLVRRGVISNAHARAAGFQWDLYNTRIADDLIKQYLAVWRSC